MIASVLAIPGIVMIPAGFAKVQVFRPASHAADAGLKPGDVIQQVNHEAVANVRAFSLAIGKSSKDDSVLLLVNRNGNKMFLAV